MSSNGHFHSNDPYNHPTGLNSHPVSRHPSALVRLVEATGRTRGSAATPRPPDVLSPAPQRGYQTQNHLTNINHNLNNTRPNQGSFSNRIASSPSSASSSAINEAVRNRNQSSSTQYPNPNQNQGFNNRNQSFSAQHSNPNQNQGFNNRNRNFSAAQLHGSQNQGQGFLPRITGSQASMQRQGLGSNMPPMTADQLAAQFQSILTDLQQTVARNPNMPTATRDMLSQQLLRIGRNFTESQQRLQQDLDRVRNERNTIQGQLDEARRQLNSVIEDRARISGERDALQLRVSELGLKSKKSIERIEDVERRWKKMNEELLERIRFQEEQLRGKRALWMDANPTSSARRNAMSALHDPFGNSPVSSQTSVLDRGITTTMNSPSVANTSQSTFSPQDQNTFDRAKGTLPQSQSTYGPAPLLGLPSSQSGPHDQPGASDIAGPPSGMTLRRRIPSMPYGKASPGIPIRSEINYDSNYRIHTEPRSECGALTPEDEVAEEFREAISKIYGLIESWVKSHTNLPHEETDKDIASSNEVLWDYMMNCTFPGRRQEAHNRVISLLRNPKTRFWFVMRMVVTYCVKDMMSVEAFKAFGPSVTETIEDVKKKLEERGLANDARQVLIDRQSEAVQSLVDSSEFVDFRTNQLHFHTKRLRNMLGPVLNVGCSRSDAGKGLGAIAVAAWDLSVKMHTSCRSFQIYFPETSSRFTTATMVAKDARLDTTLLLQMRQARLMLVITPVITMRDDRGTSILTKNLHMSNVLIME